MWKVIAAIVLKDLCFMVASCHVTSASVSRKFTLVQLPPKWISRKCLAILLDPPIPDATQHNKL